ncbi:hypothetical protein DXG01_016921 [Tephrocybe rancida]|nr:hypothetical protein DXG01_016921 [Tephrocybe rancida]
MPCGHKPASAPKLYFCECPRYCKRLRQVPKTTYNNHARAMHRDAAQASIAARTIPAHSDSGPVMQLDEDVHSHQDEEIQQSPIQDYPQPHDPDEDLLDNIQPHTDDMDAIQELLPDPGSLDALAAEELQNDNSEHHNGINNDTDDNDDDDDDDPATGYSIVEEVQIAQQFIEALRNADINNGDLSPDAVENLLHPPEYSLDLDDKSDADLIQCLRLFLHGHDSTKHYNKTVHDLRIRHPEDNLLSYDQLKCAIRQLTGIAPIISNMCPSSCLAYTGPLHEKQTCHCCGLLRLDPTTGKSRQELLSIPPGPCIQALKQHTKTAAQMDYFWQRSQALLKELRNNGEIELIDDIVCGTDVLLAVERGDISEHDTVLMFSFDGAQIYRNKQSDCWISIGIIVAFSPDLRYKKRLVLPGSITPGPKKIKIIESCLFPSLHHIAAVNKAGGLPVWDASRQLLVKSKLYTVLATADGPRMVYLNGLVGHSGKMGCRLWCGLVGRHKPGTPMHYPVLAKPDNYNVAGCSHDDVPPHIVNPIDPVRYQECLCRVLNSRNQTDYEYQRRETGICKPSIFSGLPNGTYLGIPHMFPVDIMHLILNLADLLIGLWRGKFDGSKGPWAVLAVDEKWQIHGSDIAHATPYLPGSFNRAPRNPAEKMSSGYKAWEFLLYTIAIGPGYFFGLLPPPFWRSYCKLFAAVRIIYQRRIRKEQLAVVHKYLIEFVAEFEALYVDHHCDRMHFVRPIVHVLVHLALEAMRVGPGIASSQWTMERNIGNLVEEIKQDSTPYANLSRRAVERAKVICLKALLPDVDGEAAKEGRLPQLAKDLGGGYALLRAMDSCHRDISDVEEDALIQFLEEDPKCGLDRIPPRSQWDTSVVRWSRLLLPSGQVARSLWKESLRPISKVRIARRVKVEFGEVRYYFRFDISKMDTRTLATISLYSRPDPELLESSSGTLWSCRHQGDAAVVVVDVKCIEAVVAVVPHSTGILGAEWADRVFIVEKPGLDISIMSGVVEEIPDEQ